MVFYDTTKEQVGLYVWLSITKYDLHQLKHDYINQSDQRAVEYTP